MHLYFLRHGKAEERAPGLSDEDRRLTPEGIAEMQEEAAGLVRLEKRFDVLYSSPLPRALETAWIVAEALGRNRDAVIVDKRLASGAFRLGNLQTLLSAQPSNARVLLVGHEPDFSSVAGTLVGGAEIDLKKGGLIYVETNRLEPSFGVLRWLLTPGHLTRASI